MAGLASFGRQLEAALDKMAAPDVRRAEIQRLAGGVLRDAQETNRREIGVVPEHRTFVDGRTAATLAGVNPDKGTVAFVFEVDVLGEVVEWAHKMLVRNSPVLSGEYRDTHRIYADRRDVTDAMPDAAARAKIKTWVLLNPLPYSRKIEVGAMKMRVPGSSAVYQGVAAMAQRRFGKKADVRFTYRATQDRALVYNPGKYELRALVGKREAHLRIKRERDLRVPALIITAA